MLLEKKGSDLHCTAHEPPLARVNGDMLELEGFGPLDPATLLELMEALATAPAWQRFQEHHDADFAYPYEAGGCRLRVNYFQDRVGPGFVCRVIPNQLPDPDKLGLPDPVRRLAGLSKGLVLVTGPTGSGKTTTLAALLEVINNRRSCHIISVEDPIEYVHEHRRSIVDQREIGEDTESFPSALKYVLRQNPDVIMIGELRDLETIQTALTAAETGHLVFATLHTNDAVQTIDRMVDVFPFGQQQQVRFQLSMVLLAILGDRTSASSPLR